MAFLDALQDTADIYSVTYAKDAAGQEAKAFNLEHGNQACRLMRGQATPQSRSKQGSFEDFRGGWTMLVPPEIDSIEKGWKVEINGMNLLVTETHPIRGDSSDIHHFAIFLKEQE